MYGGNCSSCYCCSFCQEGCSCSIDQNEPSFFFKILERDIPPNLTSTLQYLSEKVSLEENVSLNAESEDSASATDSQDSSDDNFEKELDSLQI